MKNFWKCVSGLCAVMTLGLTAANAQTVANGPYYATPSWDQTLPAATRFIVLSNFNNEAVLDRETGLVWERSPGTVETNWVDAMNRCTLTKIGNRMGWKLPTVQELFSLLDPSVATGLIALPAGHPFTNVQRSFYWSATNSPKQPEVGAWGVPFIFSGNATFYAKSVESVSWCVRGGQAIDVQ